MKTLLAKKLDKAPPPNPGLGVSAIKIKCIDEPDPQAIYSWPSETGSPTSPIVRFRLLRRKMSERDHLPKIESSTPDPAQ
jgi:hypothetical protein